MPFVYLVWYCARHECHKSCGLLEKIKFSRLSHWFAFKLSFVWMFFLKKNDHWLVNYPLHCDTCQKWFYNRIFVFKKATPYTIVIAFCPQMSLLMVNWKLFKSTSCCGGIWRCLVDFLTPVFRSLLLMPGPAVENLLVKNKSRPMAETLNRKHPTNIFSSITNLLFSNS